MNCIFDSATRQRIRQHVASADALYFARHPEAVARLRHTVPCEANTPIDSKHILVVRLDEGCYLRLPIGEECEPRLHFIRLSFPRQEGRAA